MGVQAAQLPKWSSMSSFNDLGLSDELLNAISDAGYTEPTPIQAQAIPPLLDGRGQPPTRAYALRVAAATF